MPDLIEMVHHVTDNVWLDIGEIALAEGGGYPAWNPEQIAWLRARWQEAQPILERIDRLLAWQNDTPDGLHHKLTAVQRALLAAYSPSPNSGKTAVSPRGYS